MCKVKFSHDLILIIFCKYRKDKVEALRVGLLKIKGQLNAVECDIANEQAVQQAFTWVEKTFGGVDL